MNNKEIFLQRKKSFRERDKEKILAELNSECAGVSTWLYEDGYFYTHMKGILFILKSNHENYIFETLVTLYEEGPAVEEGVLSPRDAAQQALERYQDLYIDEVDDGN